VARIAEVRVVLTEQALAVLRVLTDCLLAVTFFTSKYTYLLFALLLVIGLYMVIASSNLVKKIIGLNLFQTAIFLFFVSAAYVREVDGETGQAPVIPKGAAAYDPYASPLPQVIVLTAIVVGVATTAVGLALIIRIYSEYGTLDEETLREVRANE
jgi:multicomponent Na+:H+ antiporter subunit C